MCEISRYEVLGTICIGVGQGIALILERAWASGDGKVGRARLSETAEPVDAPSPLLVLRKLPRSNLLRPYSGLTGSNSARGSAVWERRALPTFPFAVVSERYALPRAVLD